MFLSFGQSRDLLVDATDAHILTAAMQYFGMSNLDSTPTKNVPPSNAKSPEKKQWLYESANQIIKSFVFEQDNSDMESDETGKKLCKL